ncbi:Lateral flagellin [Aeromonas veronii]|uniref:flagellin N-terminal helical domain-containing protein n=1 Tax=Aeromonas veronii TaxID=654 RepID=UPI003C6EE32E
MTKRSACENIVEYLTGGAKRNCRSAKKDLIFTTLWSFFIGVNPNAACGSIYFEETKMSLSIHTNFAAMVTQNQLASTNKLASTAMQRLGTGMRINSAADDAAGLQIATRLQSQSNSQKTGMRNAQDAISMMQTAEGAMDEMTNIVQRMKDLATQAANGTSSDKDIAAMNAEFGELTKELKNIAGNTTFGGENLLDSTNGKFAKGKVTFQIGGTDKETLTVDIGETLKKVVGGAAKSAADVAAFAAVTSPETDLANAQTALKTKQDEYSPLKEAEDNAKRVYDADTTNATNKTAWEGKKINSRR